MNSYKFGRRELFTLGTIVILAPALRLFPTGATDVAGKAAWLSALCAIPFLLLYMWFLTRFMSKRLENESLSDMILRLLGKKLGLVALSVVAVWFTLYAGFILRSEASRMIVTIYPNVDPAFFSIIMGVISLIAALGSTQSIVRVARMVQPVVLGSLLLIIVLSLPSIKTENLLPLTIGNAMPMLGGSVSAINIVALGAYIMCFIEGSTPIKDGRFRVSMLWVVLTALLLMLISISIVGSFGAELTKMLSRPFFVLVRNLVFFNTVERVEALVVMFWIFPDFVLVSVSLYVAQYSLRLILGKQPGYNGEGLTDFSNGRYMIWLCATAAMLCSIYIAPNTLSMDFWSMTLIPILNLSFAFILLPLVYVAAKIKKTL